MKKLIVSTVLGLAIGLSNSSFAVNIVDTEQRTKESQELSTEISGGKVETSPMSFYFDPVKTRTGRSHTAKAAQIEEPTLLVFGVSL